MLLYNVFKGVEKVLSETVRLGIIHKIRPLYESLYRQKWRKWNTSTQGPSTKYDHFMRVCTDKNEENEEPSTWGTIHKFRPPYESFYEQKWRKWKISNAEILRNSPYTCSTRVIMRIFSLNYFSFSSILHVQSLIKWSYFVDSS